MLSLSWWLQWETINKENTILKLTVFFLYNIDQKVFFLYENVSLNVDKFRGSLQQHNLLNAR